VNYKLKTRARIPDLEAVYRSITDSDREKAEAFNEFFSSAFTTEDMHNVMYQTGMTQLLAVIDIEEEDVLKTTKSSKVDKSPGPDNIHL
jgi:hypothetical protein